MALSEPSPFLIACRCPAVVVDEPAPEEVSVGYELALSFAAASSSSNQPLTVLVAPSYHSTGFRYSGTLEQPASGTRTKVTAIVFRNVAIIIPCQEFVLGRPDIQKRIIAAFSAKVGPRITSDHTIYHEIQSDTRSAIAAVQHKRYIEQS